MAGSAYELLGQRGDRMLGLMYRNRQLSDAWMGLTHLLATLSEEEGWIPERMRFRSPHLHPNGMVRFKFTATRGGGARYYSAFQEEIFGRFLANTNAAVVEFLDRCTTWRRAFETMNVCVDNFAFERGVRIGDLSVATGRAIPGLAWFRVFTTSDAKRQDAVYNATHRSLT